METALATIAADPQIAAALAALDRVAADADTGGQYSEEEHARLCALIGDRLLTLIAEA